MILRPLQDVTRIIYKLPRRSFTTKPAARPRSSVLGPALQYLNVELPKRMERSSAFRLSPAADPKQILRCKFASDRYYTRQTDRLVTMEPPTARTIQRFDFYSRKRDLEPLWIDVNSPEPQAVYVREEGKRRLRGAIATALRAKGIHPHGWDLQAYTEYWQAQPTVERKDPSLHPNQDWIWQLPVRIQGTLVIHVVRSIQLALASQAGLRAMAEGIVAEMLAKSPRPAKGGPEPRPPSRHGRQPWMKKLAKGRGSALLELELELNKDGAGTD